MGTITVLQYLQTGYDTKKHYMEPGDQKFMDQWKELINFRKEDDNYVPDTPNTLSVVKCTEPFIDLIQQEIGARKIMLAYVME